MKKGFTLVELLAVVFIIGILSAVALPKYRRSVERTRIAEVQTLLRSIYESQERILWQRGFSDYPKALENDQGFGFEKLDITIKGTYAPSTSGIATGILQTENFEYEMSPDLSDGNSLIIARPIKGDYKDKAIVSFNGKEFVCGPEGAKACSVWAANTWNQL